VSGERTVQDSHAISASKSRRWWQLDYEDTHVVAYSLKKLVAAGLVQAEKQGKEVFYSPTPQGEAFVQQYRVVREECLVKNLDTELNADIGELARLLRTMSGLYDQAARSASAM